MLSRKIKLPYLLIVPILFLSKVALADIPGGLPDYYFGGLWQGINMSGCYSAMAVAPDPGMPTGTIPSWLLAGTWNVPGTNQSYIGIQTHNETTGVTNTWTSNPFTTTNQRIEQIAVSQDGTGVAFFREKMAGGAGDSGFAQYSVDSGVTFASLGYSLLVPNYGGALFTGPTGDRRAPRSLLYSGNTLFWAWLWQDLPGGFNHLQLGRFANGTVSGLTQTLTSTLKQGGVTSTNPYNIDPWGHAVPGYSLEMVVTNTPTPKLYILFLPGEVGPFGPAGQTIYYYPQLIKVDPITFQIEDSIFIGHLDQGAAAITPPPVSYYPASSTPHNPNEYPMFLATDGGANLFIGTLENITNVNGANAINYKFIRFPYNPSIPNGYVGVNTNAVIGGVQYPIHDTRLDVGTETGGLMTVGSSVLGASNPNQFLGRIYHFDAYRPYPAQPNTNLNPVYMNKVILSYVTPEDVANGAPITGGNFKTVVFDPDTGAGLTDTVVRNDATASIFPSFYPLDTFVRSDQTSLFTVNNASAATFCQRLRYYTQTPPDNVACVHASDIW